MREPAVSGEFRDRSGTLVNQVPLPAEAAALREMLMKSDAATVDASDGTTRETRDALAQIRHMIRTETRMALRMNTEAQFTA